MSHTTKGSYADVTLSLLRIAAALLFMQHGAQKLFGVLGRESPVELMTLMGLAGVLELFGGFVVLIGAYTRPMAFVLSGEMAVAYFMSHFPRGFFPIQNGGERAALFCFVFLALSALGGGSLSVDGQLRKKT